MKRQVLILSNPLNHEGGVVNYYNLFLRNFKSDNWQLTHFAIGSRAALFYQPILKRIMYPFVLLYDFIRYFFLLLFNWNIQIVQVSPSLIPVPLLRDGCFLLAAALFRRKRIIFFRGWKVEMLNILETNQIIRTLFQIIYLRPNHKLIVLAESFKTDLINLGARSDQVFVTTTAIEKNNIIVSPSPLKREKINVLFLGRVAQLKGLDEIIATIIQLSQRNELNTFSFTIAGHEDRKGYIQELESKLEQANISKSSVVFAGRVIGNAKYELYSKQDIYLLPSYTEGCPNSVLEALASGMFCITTNVGALKDLIEEENGTIIEVRSPESLLNALLASKLAIEEIRSRRHTIAQKSQLKFDITPISTWFESIYNG